MGGLSSRIAAVAEAGDVEAEAAEIIGEEDGTANFGIDGVTVGVGKRETEGERGEFVDVGDEAPVMGPEGLHFELLLVAALLDAAVNHAEIVVVNGGIFEGAARNFARSAVPRRLK